MPSFAWLVAVASCAAIWLPGQEFSTSVDHGMGRIWHEFEALRPRPSPATTHQVVAGRARAGRKDNRSAAPTAWELPRRPAGPACLNPK